LRCLEALPVHAHIIYGGVSLVAECRDFTIDGYATITNHLLAGTSATEVGACH
jgi:hypothetical protein